MKTFAVMALLAIAAMITPGTTLAQGSGSTSIFTGFTDADIPAGRTLWFAATIKVTGAPTYPLTIYFRNQTISCAAFSFSVPNGELILDPSYTHPVSSFDGTTWITTAPPNEPGSYFIAAGQYINPTAVTPGKQTPVTWSGTFSASRTGVSINWRWWSASYYSFNGPIYEDGVKACDCSACTQWAGTDHAGTPEYVNTEHDLSGLNIYTGGGTGYSYTDSLAVTCSDAFAPIASVSASATSICSGDSVTFTASAVNGGATPSWQWKKNGVHVGTNSATYIAHGLGDLDSVSVTLTSSDSLASPTTAVSNAIVITVNPTPSAATITGAATVCAGATFALSASKTGGTWSSSNTAIGTVSASGSVTGTGVGTSIISYTISNTCGTAVATKVVTVSPGFSVSGTLTSPTCNGYTNGSVVASVTPRRAHTYTYAWSNGSTSFGLWGVGAGTYTLTATNEAGCAITKALTVTQPAPLASTNSVTDAYPRGGNNGAIYYGVSGGTWPYTYSWSNGATTQNITGLTAGSYLVTVTDANSCTLTNWFSVSQPGGVGARMAGSTANTPAAEAYPNPFSTEATIAFSTPQAGHTTIDVYNVVTGAKEATIFNDNTNAGQEYSCTLSGTQLTSGVYCYKIISADKELYTGRLVLVK